MNDMSLFEVSREEYKQFVKRIKPGCGEIANEEINRHAMATKIMSKKTGKCLCSRVCYDDETPEQYYIFEIPDADESQEYIPCKKVVLETREQVQAFFDVMAKLSKENKENA